MAHPSKHAHWPADARGQGPGQRRRSGEAYQ
jgi:hypothetical protein